MIDSTDPAETWTLTQAAAHIGAGSPASARRTLGRWGIKAIGRNAGRGGETLYDAKAVRDAKARRPGQGARTDLLAGARGTTGPEASAAGLSPDAT